MASTDKSPGDPQKSGHPKWDPTESDKFRAVLGIITPKTLNSPKNSYWANLHRTHDSTSKGEESNSNLYEFYEHCDEQNKGLYTRLCERESTRRSQYLVCVYVLDFCYMAQIAVSAVLNALGASRSSFIAITTFGAINVAIAGVLALFKGLGLPMRLRKDWLEFQNLRQYIDDQERMFEIGLNIESGDEKGGCGCKMCKCEGGKCDCGGHNESKKNDKSPGPSKSDEKDPSGHLKKEIKKIQKMYADLMTTIENNQPDFYASSPASGGSKRHQVANSSLILQQ